ncbi:unnamed protein product [Arctogadus glacialis]
METSVGMVTARRRLLRPSHSAHTSEDWCRLGGSGSSAAQVWSGLSRTAAVCSVVYRLIFSASARSVRGPGPLSGLVGDPPPPNTHSVNTTPLCAALGPPTPLWDPPTPLWDPPKPLWDPPTPLWDPPPPLCAALGPPMPLWDPHRPSGTPNAPLGPPNAPLGPPNAPLCCSGTPNAPMCCSGTPNAPLGPPTPLCAALGPPTPLWDPPPPLWGPPPPLWGPQRPSGTPTAPLGPPTAPLCCSVRLRETRERETVSRDTLVAPG